MGRSGSSFLGGLLNSQKHVFYVFEPLHDIQGQHRLNRATAIEALRGIFTCQVNKDIMTFFKSNPRFAIKQYFGECARKPSCLSASAINAACYRKTIRVVKTIRTRVSWLEDLLDDLEANVKVIHLLRDPRASIISGWGRGWTIKASVSCNDIQNDVTSGFQLSKQYADKYMAVRYEDLCDNPWGLAKHIFAFLGYSSLPDSTIRFLKTSTSSISEGAYSIRRNTRRMQQKWRSIISEKDLTEIESICSPVISMLGFHVFRDIQNVRNYSKPLYNDNYKNTLFKYDI
ncbi:hypothetical protein SK128_012950 [Halocaridina rubra]|uniref:Sulfotransferase domain-containing protein n=1 Tax=Halocaridina rubra TaxID=373956 RepID=A0AAN8X8J5_HALRR